jgi:hypothetical protein
MGEVRAIAIHQLAAQAEKCMRPSALGWLVEKKMSTRSVNCEGVQGIWGDHED